MRKLENSELWEVYGPTEKEIEERQAQGKAAYAAALNGVQDWIIANLSSLKVSYETEEGGEPATIMDLQRAVNSAKTEELERFLAGSRKLFFEDGYLDVRRAG